MTETVGQDAPAREKSWLERALSVVTEVRAGEGASALILAANVFALLAFYYILKTVREALILSESGAEVKSYSAAGQALLLAVLIPVYGALASRVSRVRLVSAVTLFFASHLVVFYVLGVAGVPIGVPFFLWIGIFNMVVIAQFWAFANDVYTSDRGRRLFPLVGLGSSLGAWLGAELAAVLFAGMGPYRLLLLSAAGLSVCVFFTVWVDRREGHRPTADRPARAEEPMGRAGGFKLVFSQRYLVLIGLLILLLNIVNTVGEFVLGKLITASAAEAVAAGTAGGLGQEAIIGEFYGKFFGWVNLLGFLFQLLLVSRIFKYVGVRGALYVLPIVAFVSYGVLAVLPVLGIVQVAKVLENSTDYSVQNTARHALFLPTSREVKYKAKQVIDGVFWRTGDLLQALVVFVGVQLAFAIRGYALVNLALVVVWLGLVVLIAREHRKLVGAGAAEKVAA